MSVTSIRNWCGGFPRGRGTSRRKVWSRNEEGRLCSLVSEDGSYKPTVKSSGSQRESEGVVVVVIGVKLKAPGAEGPRVDRPWWR